VDTESLVFRLMPQAEMSGRVTDEVGDPVRHAAVALYREGRELGNVRVTRAGFTQTDDLGEYELSHLAPGRYFLSATATPWYAVHPPVARQGANYGVVDSIDASLEVAYPETFYPEATDSSGAQAISLKGGDTTRIDLQLVAVRAVTVTVPHIASSSAGVNQQRVALTLQRKVFDGLEQVPVAMQGTPTEMTLVGVPPGHYVLNKQSIQQEPGGGVRSSEINLTNGTLTVDENTGQEMGNVKLTGKAADGGSLPAGTNFSLTAKGGKESQGRVLNEKGEAEIDGLKPGEYYLGAFGGARQYFVSRMLSEGKDLLDQTVHVTTGTTVLVTAMVNPAAGSLDGFVQKDGKLAAGAMVLLLPSDEVRRTRYVWRDQSDLDGGFHLSGIPPGQYVLLAIEDGWEVEWQREDVLALYLPKAMPVVVPETGKTAVKLDGPVEVQAR
jgi:hypothetical protein